jgi:hypothetical protein
MISSMHSTPYFSGSMTRVNRSSEAAPLAIEERVIFAPSAATPRNDKAAKSDVGASERSTRKTVTFDDKGRLLFQIIDNATNEVRRQYPDEVVLKIREYVAAKDRAAAEATEPSLKLVL